MPSQAKYLARIGFGLDWIGFGLDLDWIWIWIGLDWIWIGFGLDLLHYPLTLFTHLHLRGFQ